MKYWYEHGGGFILKSEYPKGQQELSAACSRYDSTRMRSHSLEDETYLTEE
jgi:hypothetical protein